MDIPPGRMDYILANNYFKTQHGLRDMFIKSILNVNVLQKTTFVRTIKSIDGYIIDTCFVYLLEIGSGSC